MDPDRTRLLTLADRLVRLRSRVSAACGAAGRDPDEVTIIAVTKNFPAADVARLAQLGLRDVGENRDQEAGPKHVEVARCYSDLRWHFVGRLQRNKARSVAGYAHMVHSVDSVRLASSLGAAAAGRDRPLEVLIQVSLDGDPTRGGAAVEQLPAIAGAVADEQMLRLRGVMAVAPRDQEPLDAYRRLAEIALQVRADHPEARFVSAGMSGDLEAAVACGATHLRVGSALLGNRPPLR
jgi:PLP dependent protein